MAAHSHGDHDGARIVADATVTQQGDKSLGLKVLVTNFGQHDLTLTDASAQDAVATRFSVPPTIPNGETATVKLSLDFRDTVPGIFTLWLSFGNHGSGPVLVMP